MTESTLRPGVTMTAIEPVPHVMPERLSLRERIHARLARPTRADLTARNEWQATEIDSLRARVLQLETTTRDAVIYAQVGDDAYNTLLRETQKFDAEYDRRGAEIGQLRRENDGLKAAHQRACDDRDREKARADRYATAAGLAAGAVDGEVVEIATAAATAPAPTFARIARRRAVSEFDESWVTTGWNRRDAQAAVAEGKRRRAIGGAA